MRMTAALMILSIAALPAFAQKDDAAKRISDRIAKLLDGHSKRVSREVTKLVKEELAKARGGAAAKWDAYLKRVGPKLADDGVTGDLKKACASPLSRARVAGRLARMLGGDPEAAAEEILETGDDGKVRVSKAKAEQVRKLVAGAARPPVKPPPAAGKALLGFSADRNFNDDDRKDLGLKAGQGIRISSVAPDGPADKAGLKVDDVILKIDDDAIADGLDDARRISRTLKPGQELRLSVRRGNETKTLTLKVGTKKE